MPTIDPRVDAYIAKSAEFARPLLVAVRTAAHQACPDVVEAIKWGMPFFTYQGKNLAHVAAFKQHLGLGLWYTARPPTLRAWRARPWATSAASPRWPRCRRNANCSAC
jgi:hypothetical protein